MLGKREAQRGLLEADTMYGDFVGRKTFYGFLAAQRDELFRDESFAGLYNPKLGRPSVAPSVLATALVLQSYDGVSDEEARRRAAFDLQWKVALGVPVDSVPFAKSTLQEFRAQLIVHHEQGATFQASLELAKRRGHFTGSRKLKLALDTTNILGQGAVKDTYRLLADGIVLVLRVLAAQAGAKFEVFGKRAGYRRYVEGPSLKGRAGINWDEPSARRRFLGEIVADADRLLEQVRVARGKLVEDSPEDQALVEAAGLLARVLIQDIERREDGAALRVGVAKDRMPSVHDPEMRHGHKSAAKRFTGHKVQLAVDTESQLITAVAAIPGNAPDHEQALAVVEQSEARTGCAVEETIGDCAYGDGPTRQQFADAERTLIAKVPAATNQGRFPKTAFSIDLDELSCTCPAGQVTRDLRVIGRRRRGLSLHRRWVRGLSAPRPVRAGERGADGPAPSPGGAAPDRSRPPEQPGLHPVPFASPGGRAPHCAFSPVGDPSSALPRPHQNPVPGLHGGDGSQPDATGWGAGGRSGCTRRWGPRRRPHRLCFNALEPLGAHPEARCSRCALGQSRLDIAQRVPPAARSPSIRPIRPENGRFAAELLVGRLGTSGQLRIVGADGPRSIQ